MRRLSLPLFITAGIACGLTAVAFHDFVELMRKLLIGAALRQHGFARISLVILVPALVSVLIALIIRRFAPPASGANLARVRRAYGQDIDLLDDRSVAATLILTPMSLGAGAPLGPEGPTVVIAAGVSMWIARLMKLPRRLIRTLIPVGTAAGIAAIFNTPITGVVFAMEEVMGNASRGVLGGAIVAAVSAAVVERLMLGGRPLLSAPSSTWHDVRELIGFAITGIVAGLVSGVAIQAVLAIRRMLARLDVPVRAAIGGVCVGLIGLVTPVILGVGYDATSLFLHGRGTIHTAGLAFAGKTLGFVVALGCGIIGGTFAPSLFIGAALGATVGHAARIFLPHAGIDPGAYALVGMGALFAGLLRCPISAVLIVIEVTGDYDLVLPLMLAVALSSVLSRRISPHNLTEIQMEEEGYRESDGDDPLLGLSAAEVMAKDIVTVRADLTLLDAARRIAGTHHRYYPVVNEEEKLIGILPASVIDDAAREATIEAPLAAHVQPVRYAARIDDEMREVIRRMVKARVDRCPVIDKADRVVGYISPSDVLRARMARVDA